MLFVSPLLSGRDVAVRVAAQHAHLPINTLRCGRLSDDERARLTAASERLAGVPLVVHHGPCGRAVEVVSVARRVWERNGSLRVVIVDAAHALRGDRSATLTGLAALAVDLHVPVIALYRTDVTDLAATGEHTADQVAVLEPDPNRASSTCTDELVLRVVAGWAGGRRSAWFRYDPVRGRFWDSGGYRGGIC